MSVSQAIPLPSLPVEHMRPVEAFILGAEWALNDRDEAERRHDDEVLSRCQRELDGLLDRIDRIEWPRWVPREADDLTVIAGAVGLLDVAA